MSLQQNKHPTSMKRKRVIFKTHGKDKNCRQRTVYLLDSVKAPPYLPPYDGYRPCSCVYRAYPLHRFYIRNSLLFGYSCNFGHCSACFRLFGGRFGGKHTLLLTPRRLEVWHFPCRSKYLKHAPKWRIIYTTSGKSGIQV